ncbi:hypothetical protein B0H10DRAFT_2427108 [Mycena sp. CBHHK59/15]|nr:hypothetical protein B0H10DRAFT_2427108 [Mycena sp. CBHHK59/15]
MDSGDPYLYDDGQWMDIDETEETALRQFPPGEEAFLQSHAGQEAIYHQMLRRVKPGRGDLRSRGDRIQKIIDLWRRQLPALIDAYLIWKEAGPTDSTSDPGAWPLTVIGLDEQGMHMFSHTPTSTSANEALICHGFIGCSPDQPALAFPLRLFEVYRQLHQVCPRFSLDALSKTLAYLHFGLRKSALASQQSTAYDAYLEIIRSVEARCRVALGRTGTWYMDNLGAMDGNNSLKSIANEFKSGSVRSDDCLKRDVHDWWLMTEEVDLFKDEVADSQKKPRGTRPALADMHTSATASLIDPSPTNPTNADATESAETDPLSDPSPDAEPGDLDDNVAWLNVNELESADVEELERCLRPMKYLLAIIKSILDRYGKDVCIGYDIMCAFFKTLLRSSLGKRVVAMKLRGVVPAFHGHAHNRACQVGWLPLYVEGVGLEDFEESKDYEDDLRSEQAYFKALRCEPPEISATVEYMELLIKLGLTKQESDKAKSDWNVQDYHIINGIGRAEIIHINTRYRTTHTKYLATEEEVCRFEETNDIVNRWTSTSQPYIDGIVLMTERRYRLAVDELERLVVQRLFEMTKLSMSSVEDRQGTSNPEGRDLTRPGQVQRRRCLVEPPRLKLSYNTIINHATLAEFDWLRETRNDIRALGWADPTRREASVLHFGIVRSKEEKTRCNVEIRRLVTSMVDDHMDQYRTIAANMVIAPELARELSRRWIVRNRINTAIAKWLAQASRLPSFTSTLFPGDREGRDSALRDGIPAPPWLSDVFHLEVVTVEYKEPVDSGDDDDKENSRTDQQQQEFDINGMGREEDFEEDSMLDLIENIRQLET